MPWGKQVMFPMVVLHNIMVMWLATAGKESLFIRFGGVCLFNPIPQPSSERMHLLTGKVIIKMRKKNYSLLF